MALQLDPESGSVASIISLEKQFGKSNLDNREEEQSSQSRQPSGESFHTNDTESCRRAPEDVPLRKESWTNLTFPQYSGDFTYVVSQVGFVGFVRDLEELNGNVVLPPFIIRARWNRLLEQKHAEWYPCDASLSEEEKAKALRSAKKLESRKNYTKYRISTFGMDKWTQIEAEMKIKATMLRRRSRRAKTALKRERKVGEEMVLGISLDKPVGIKKMSNRKKRPTRREREAMKDAIAKRLQSTTEAPHLLPLEEEDAAVSVPGLGRDVDLEMELC
ncbi:uncharacterized protein RSE6_00581 [Rhynchosporium secalis]|uniref:Uncharacterized protein n=1 Tax=Rhynchosporium secalis TaxID=38038 RepID=A0A1E1LVP9_RHYSE|nr:uncharacterized protein RSE6_00581 [Rhynchosporium secalis]